MTPAHLLKIQVKRHSDTETANEAVGRTAASAELSSRAAFGNIYYSLVFPQNHCADAWSFLRAKQEINFTTTAFFFFVAGN